MSNKQNNPTTKACVKVMRKIKDIIPDDCEAVVIFHNKKRKEMAFRVANEETEFPSAMKRAARRWVAALMMKKMGGAMTGAQFKFLKGMLDRVGKKRMKRDAESIWEKRMKGDL